MAQVTSANRYGVKPPAESSAPGATGHGCKGVSRGAATSADPFTGGWRLPIIAHIPTACCVSTSAARLHVQPNATAGHVNRW